jgi:hypothetical protein
MRACEPKGLPAVTFGGGVKFVTFIEFRNGPALFSLSREALALIS